jgi:hypothetical protein
MISAESLAGICTLWILLLRTVTPAAFENRFPSSSSLASEAGA